MDDINKRFSEIYNNNIEKIYRFVYLKVNSQEVAEDITSQVFVNCLEAFKKSQDAYAPLIKNMGAFLYRAANNAVTDYYREKGKGKVVPADFTAHLSDDRTNIHERAMVNSDMEIVKSALGGLKKDYQDVIIWHYLEDMSFEEISQIIDKPEGTVRVMLHRGLKALKNELSEDA